MQLPFSDENTDVDSHTSTSPPVSPVSTFFPDLPFLRDLEDLSKFECPQNLNPWEIGPIELSKEIRRGTHTVIFEAKSKKDNSLYAAKVMKHESPDGIVDHMAACELYCLEALQESPHVLNLQRYLKTDTYTLLLLDRAKFDLYDFHPLRPIAEETARCIIKCILSGLRDVHAQGIVHGDIKEENILLLEKQCHLHDEEFEYCAVLADFGHAFRVPCHYNYEQSTFVGDHYRLERIGTIGHHAPELLVPKPEQLNRFMSLLLVEMWGEQLPPIDFAVDIWELGITLFTLVTGVSPFGAYSTLCELIDGIAEFDKRQHDALNDQGEDRTMDIWLSLSDDVRDLFHKMVDLDPRYRPSIDEIENHPWFLPRSPSPSPPPYEFHDGEQAQQQQSPTSTSHPPTISIDPCRTPSPFGRENSYSSPHHSHSHSHSYSYDHKKHRQYSQSCSNSFHSSSPNRLFLTANTSPSLSISRSTLSELSLWPSPEPNSDSVLNMRHNKPPSFVGHKPEKRRLYLCGLPSALTPPPSIGSQISYQHVGPNLLQVQTDIFGSNKRSSSWSSAPNPSEFDSSENHCNSYEEINPNVFPRILEGHSDELFTNASSAFPYDAPPSFGFQNDYMPTIEQTLSDLDMVPLPPDCLPSIASINLDQFIPAKIRNVYTNQAN